MSLLEELTVLDTLEHSESTYLEKSPFAVMTWAAGSWTDATGGAAPKTFSVGTSANYYSKEEFSGASQAVAYQRSIGKDTAERFWSLWLCYNNTSHNGYRAKFVCQTDETTAIATLYSVASGTETELGKSSAFTLNAKDEFALWKNGTSIQVWRRPKGEGTWEKLCEGTSSTYTTGFVGFDGSGSDPKFTKLERGTGASFPETELLDSFIRSSESPLSDGGKWTKPSWPHAAGHISEEAWGPETAFGTGDDGAYWNPTEYTERAVAWEVHKLIAGGFGGRYFLLWNCLTTAESGYAARFAETSEGKYTVTLEKWTSGTKEVLEEVTEVAVAVGNSVGLWVHGGNVSIWKKVSGTWSEITRASSSTYTKGFIGIEGGGTGFRARNFEVSKASGTTKQELKATLAASATLTGNAHIKSSVAATIVSTATFSGKLKTSEKLAATISSVGTLAGSLHSRTGLAATLAGAGAVEATLRTRIKLAATITSDAEVDAFLTIGAAPGELLVMIV